MKQKRSYHGCTIIDDMDSKTIYVAGGWDENYNKLSSMETMKLTENEWKLSSVQLPKPLSYLQLVSSRSKNYILYIPGGWDGSDFQKKIYGLKRQNQEWEEIGSLQTKRGYHTTLNVDFNENCELL